MGSDVRAVLLPDRVAPPNDPSPAETPPAGEPAGYGDVDDPAGASRGSLRRIHQLAPMKMAPMTIRAHPADQAQDPAPRRRARAVRELGGPGRVNKSRYEEGDPYHEEGQAETKVASCLRAKARTPILRRYRVGVSHEPTVRNRGATLKAAADFGPCGRSVRRSRAKSRPRRRSFSRELVAVPSWPRGSGIGPSQCGAGSPSSKFNDLRPAVSYLGKRDPHLGFDLLHDATVAVFPVKAATRILLKALGFSSSFRGRGGGGRPLQPGPSPPRFLDGAPGHGSRSALASSRG